MPENCEAPPFIPIATSEELGDSNSWVNTTYQWPQDPYDDICRELAQAMFAWGSVESSLFTIFATSLQSANKDVSAATWYSLESFRARREITDATHKNSGLAGFDEDRWKKLLERSRRRSTARNFIAHGQLFYEHTVKDPARKFFVSIPKLDSGIDKRNYASDIKSVKESFTTLGEDLKAYWLNLLGQ